MPTTSLDRSLLKPPVGRTLKTSRRAPRARASTPRTGASSSRAVRVSQVAAKSPAGDGDALPPLPSVETSTSGTSVRNRACVVPPVGALYIAPSLMVTCPCRAVWVAAAVETSELPLRYDPVISEAYFRTRPVQVASRCERHGPPDANRQRCHKPRAGEGGEAGQVFAGGTHHRRQRG